MTRADWGEKFTYNGPLNAEYFSSWDEERLVEYIDDTMLMVLEPDYNEALRENDLYRLVPLLEGLESKAKRLAEKAAGFRQSLAEAGRELPPL